MPKLGNWSVYSGPYHEFELAHVVIYKRGTPDEESIQCFHGGTPDKAQAIVDRLNAGDKLHIPTGLPCHVMQHGAIRSLCNFHDRTNPFTWVNNNELM